MCSPFGVLLKSFLLRRRVPGLESASPNTPFHSALAVSLFFCSVVYIARDWKDPQWLERDSSHRKTTKEPVDFGIV